MKRILPFFHENTMFRKRTKRTFPPGTFIPTPSRVCAIIQLCLAFTVLLWNLAEPFAGEIFTYKSQLLLYQDVMGIPSASLPPSEEKKERLTRNADRFHQLPKKTQQELQKGLRQVEKNLNRSFIDKLNRSLHILFYEMPTFEKAWLILSLIIPILLLKRVEGAALAVWLLPMVTACYAIDNRIQGLPNTQTAEEALYPSEKILVENYLPEPLNTNIFEQRDQLLKAWQLYLVTEWAGESPSSDPAILAKQAESGEYAFNTLRLQKMFSSPRQHPPLLEPLWLLALYFFWNVYFAYTAWKWRNF